MLERTTELGLKSIHRINLVLKMLMRRNIESGGDDNEIQETFSGTRATEESLGSDDGDENQ